MLTKIILDNYTTFINSTELDFSATNYKFLESENVGRNRILKGALFVGENASGKTKILQAIKLLLDLLFRESKDKSSNKSFFTKKPTFSLEYHFNVDESKIIYFLEFGINNTVIKEVLTVDDKVLIDRMSTCAKFNFDEEKIYNDVNDKLLFLRRVYFDTNFYDDITLIKWFEFLKKSVYINCYEKNVIPYDTFTPLRIYDFLDAYGPDSINEFLEKIGYNQSIDYLLVGDDEESLKTSDKFALVFEKKGYDNLIDVSDESTGNKTLLSILPAFLHATKTNCMIIADEFSSGFHNELEECLLKYFYHYSKNSQLFFTSHSTNILNNTIIRPDQIYSVTFKGKEGSKIKRFSDEMPRKAQNTEKMYLNGVFDGMPRYNKVFKD